MISTHGINGIIKTPLPRRTAFSFFAQAYMGYCRDRMRYFYIEALPGTIEISATRAAMVLFHQSPGATLLTSRGVEQ
jgi:hypothetical protein